MKKSCNVLQPKIPQFSDFLIHQHKEFKLSYSAMNTCRSAVSSLVEKVEGFRVGEHPIICALLKGFYHLSPPKPKYSHYWDVNVILNLFQTWGDNCMLSLKFLSYKVAVLLLLVTSSRGQTIVHLPVETM